MYRLRLLLLFLLAITLMFGGSLVAQEAKKDPEPKKDTPAPRLKGQLPQNYSKLGLTDVQKQQVYKLQGDYDARYAEIESQIKKLRQEEKQAIEKVLTDAQRARLKEILTEKIGIDPAKPEAKPAEPKPAEKKTDVKP